MSELISGPLPDGVAEQAQGSDAFQSTAGEKFGADVGNAVADLPVVRMSGAIQRNFNNSWVDPEAPPGFLDDAPISGPQMAPDDATALAKQNGSDVTFTSPIAQSSAQTIIDDHLAAAKRQKVIDNYQGGTLSTLGSFGVSALVGLADPIQLGAMAIPVVPEAFVAGKLAMAASAFERTLIRGAAGAANGAAGMAALEPLDYAMSKGDYTDWTVTGALRDLAFGAAMGGAGHMLMGGLFGDTHVSAKSPEETMEAFQAGVGQVLDGRPADAGLTEAIQKNAMADSLEQPRIDPDTGRVTPDDNTVRVFHGGSADSLDGGGSRFVSDDPAYAQGYADKSDGGRLYYADLAQDDPRLVKTFDDTGTDQTASYAPFEVDAGELSPVQETAARLRDEATQAQSDYAARQADPQQHPDLERADRTNAQTLAQAPEVHSDIEKQLTEASKLAGDLRAEVQQEIAAGRIHPEKGSAELAASADIEKQGKAAAGYAACLAAKGF